MYRNKQTRQKTSDATNRQGLRIDVMN